MSELSPESALEQTLALLRQLGATDADLADPDFEPSALAAMLSMTPERDTISLRELAERSGADLDDVVSIRLALGSATDDLDSPSATESDVEFMRSLGVAIEFFGATAVHDLARVIGGAATRMGDALVSMFIVNMGRRQHSTAEDDLIVTQANASAAQFMPLMMHAIDTAIRRHVVNNGRGTDSPAGEFETQHIAIGFADLVGSTRLTRSLSFVDAGRLFRAFDETTTRTVVANGGRVVKLIGDEVMFAADDLDAAVTISAAVRTALAANTAMPPTRGGVAFGPALLRDGDVYGNVVNLAARLAKAAPAASILVADPDDVLDAGEPHVVAGLDGIDEPVPTRLI